MKNLNFIILFISLFSFNTQAQNSWQPTAYFPNSGGIYGNCFATDFTATGRVVVGGHGNCGCIFKSLDGGNTWENIGSPTGTILNMSIYPWTPNALLAVVNNSSNNGALYRYYNTSGGYIWGAVSAFDGKDVRTVMAKNYLFTGVAGDASSRGIWICYNDAGTNWSRVESGYDIYCFYTKNGKFYAGGYNPNLSNGILLKSENLGLSWSPIADFTNRVLGITVSDSNDVFVAWGISSTAKISASLNGGSFNVVYNTDIPFTNEKVPIVSNSLGQVFFGARNQGVYKTTNKGINWVQFNTGLSSLCVTDLLISPDQSIYAAHECGLMEYVDKRSTLTNVQNICNEVPYLYSLFQNYPNPFNPVTNISFELPKTSIVKIVIYDLLGNEIETIVDKKLNPGRYRFFWDASKYSSGIYFYRIMASDFMETRKMLFVK